MWGGLDVLRRNRINMNMNCEIIVVNFEVCHRHNILLLFGVV